MQIATGWTSLNKTSCKAVFSTVVYSPMFSYHTATAYSWLRYVDLKDNPDSQIDGVSVEFTTNLDYYNNLKITWLVLGENWHHGYSVAMVMISMVTVAMNGF